ncbi:hypothetical protein WN51_02704 [Melipona quadrifasciata]|uniref:Uncharacterized protein n=1 Tax=Melipona quadrifasciata TaxID=166423 RepID=A0A0M9AAY0_9HYME|nr:hypothetical protein WN51_02704 [Melipona quadrifasciata]
MPQVPNKSLFSTLNHVARDIPNLMAAIGKLSEKSEYDLKFVFDTINDPRHEIGDGETTVEGTRPNEMQNAFRQKKYKRGNTDRRSVSGCVVAGYTPDVEFHLDGFHENRVTHAARDEYGYPATVYPYVFTVIVRSGVGVITSVALLPVEPLYLFVILVIVVVTHPHSILGHDVLWNAGPDMQGAAGQAHDPVAGGAQPVRDDSRDGVGAGEPGEEGKEGLTRSQYDHAERGPISDSLVMILSISTRSNNIHSLAIKERTMFLYMNEM